MKKTILLLSLCLMMLAGCGSQQSTCEHTPGAAATCTESQVCTTCGEMLQPALGHDEVLTDCEAGSCCARCGALLSEGKAHTPGDAATCSSPQVCTVCGKTLADPVSHTPSGEASCTEDVVCTICGETLISAGHTPSDGPSCIDEQVCLRCFAVLQPALGHAADTTAEAATVTCARCGVTMALSPDADPNAYIDETVVDAHYHNTLDAYYSGNVLVCGDYALEYFSMSEGGSAEWASAEWASAVNAFAARFPELNVSALLVPKSCAFHAPDGYVNQYDNQAAFISATYAQLQSSITAVDAAGLMAQHSGEYLFYRTDHHWTALGAYYASVAYCQQNEITPRQLGSYETTVNTGYVGSLYSFCTEPPACLQENPDYTVCHLPLAQYTMSYDNGSGFAQGLVLNTETNAYASAFLGGDNALTRITTDNQTGRNLLVFKESYGNAFVPFMIDYYDEIIVVDIRKDTAGIADLLSEYNITDALIINNVQASTSLTDTLAAKLAS